MSESEAEGILELGQEGPVEQELDYGRPESAGDGRLETLEEGAEEEEQEDAAGASMQGPPGAHMLQQHMEDRTGTPGSSGRAVATPVSSTRPSVASQPPAMRASREGLSSREGRPVSREAPPSREGLASRGTVGSSGSAGMIGAPGSAGTSGSKAEASSDAGVAGSAGSIEPASNAGPGSRSGQSSREREAAETSGRHSGSSNSSKPPQGSSSSPAKARPSAPPKPSSTVSKQLKPSPLTAPSKPAAAPSKGEGSKPTSLPASPSNHPRPSQGASSGSSGQPTPTSQSPKLPPVSPKRTTTSQPTSPIRGSSANLKQSAPAHQEGPKPPRARHATSNIDPVYLETETYTRRPGVGNVYDWSMHHQINYEIGKERKAAAQEAKVREALEKEQAYYEESERAFQEWLHMKQRQRQSTAMSLRKAIASPHITNSLAMYHTSNQALQREAGWQGNVVKGGDEYIARSKHIKRPGRIANLS